MLRISWQTLRARRTTLAGAFIAIWLAVTLAYATGMLMTAALEAPGPGRFAAADAVVRADPSVVIGSGEDAEAVDVIPAPRLEATAVADAARVPGVHRAVGDIAFPASAWDAHGVAVDVPDTAGLQGHGWPSAALTPYELSQGRAPQGPRDVVADARMGVRPGSELRIATPAGDATYRVSGIADSDGAGDPDQAALFFAADVAGELSGTPGRVNAIGVLADRKTPPAALREGLREHLGGDVEVLDASNAADADAGDAQAASRPTLVAVFGTMGGIAGVVALFVVAGTFALAIAQRRRETAVLRALGATPRQVCRLIAAEALIVSLVATGLGVLAGGPLASAIGRAVVEHGLAPHGFEPSGSWIALAAAIGMGVLVAQLAVIAAAWRAGRVPPADALREVAVEHPRPGAVRLLAGVVSLAGGAAMAVIFAGEAASAFAILGAMLSATGVALLGRWLLGIPAAMLALPLRRAGDPGLLAATGLAANRWRTAALATPIVLITMLVATQGVLQASDLSDTERVSAARVTADHVVVGRDGAPLPVGTAAHVARLPGVESATGTLPTEVFLLGHGLSGWDAPWKAAGVDLARGTGALDPRVLRGDLGDVGGNAVAVSDVVAAEGRLRVGDVMPARMADTRRATLRVAAVYERAAGLGHVLLDSAVARRHAADPTDSAVFVAGGPAAAKALDRHARTHQWLTVLSRSEYLRTTDTALRNTGTWGVWLVIGLSLAFAVLALLNTAAMATSERRGELATIRLLGGTPGQATRMIGLEMAPTVIVGVLAGAAVAAAAVMRVGDGPRGVPLVVPAVLIAALVAGAALLALAAGTVTARLALRTSPADAMRVNE